MSTVLDSVQYKYEKSRAEVVNGVKRIVWWFLIVSVVLLVPMYFIGKATSNVFVSKNTNNYTIIEITTVKPEIRNIESNTLTYSDNNRGYYVKVSNKLTSDPNKRDVGYYPWVYDYIIKDASGAEIETSQVISYLLPNQEKYVIGPVSRDPGLKFEIRTNEALSVPVKFNLQNSPYPILPQIRVANTSANTNKINRNLVDIAFTIKNDSDYMIKKVDNYFIIRNVDNRIVGVGRYTSDNLDAGEERKISLKYPNPNLGSSTTLEVIPEYNYMDQENVILTMK